MSPEFKAVITAGGLGTRLLPSTKEMPKEMLPIPLPHGGTLSLKPVVQAVFEQLFDGGYRDFCFVVGRGKRAIEDHFTPDNSYPGLVRGLKSSNAARTLLDFYTRVEKSSLTFVNQPSPRGFGDAVMRARPFTGKDSFLLHAGDDLILSKVQGHLKRMRNTFDKLRADCVFFVEPTATPEHYGIVDGKEIDDKLIEVKSLVEKPRKSSSNLAVVAVYMFKPIIYQAIEKIRPDGDGEIQLAAAIKWLIDRGQRVYAVRLQKNEKRIDIGTPETYVRDFKILSDLALDQISREK